MSGSFLSTIGRERLERVRLEGRGVPIERLRDEAEGRRGERRAFLGELRRGAGDPLRVIGEVKKASPSAGTIREDYHPDELAASYVAAGAAAISVLTEPARFLGSFDHLDAVRARVAVPLLLKDFVVHERQIYEAGARGADAVLLIVALLPAGQLRDFAHLCGDLSLDALLEVHEPRELETALSLPGAVGVNNRDLRTLEVRRGQAESMLPMIPADRVRVAESGYHTRAEIERLEELGADAVLIGEALLRRGDVRAGFVELFGQRAGGSEKEAS